MDYQDKRKDEVKIKDKEDDKKTGDKEDDKKTGDKEDYNFNNNGEENEAAGKNNPICNIFGFTN